MKVVFDADKLEYAKAEYAKKHRMKVLSNEKLAELAKISAPSMSNADKENFGLGIDLAERVAAVLDKPLRDLLLEKEIMKLPRLPKPHNSWHVPYCIHFRGNAEITEEYYLKPLREPGEVSIATIMTKESFEKGFDGLGADTKLNVYIWKPRTAGEIIAVGKHESRGLVDTDILMEAKVDQVRRSLAGWAKRARENKNIRVKTYDWMPSIKIVMWHGKSITVEIMTYNTNTKFRPCLLLRRNDPQEAPVFAEYEQQIKWFDEHGIDLLDENKEIRDKPIWF